MNVDTNTTPETEAVETIVQSERYLVASIDNTKIAFPAFLVQEIMVFKRSQILQLPFYNQSLRGVVHHQNQVVPLVSGKTIFFEKADRTGYNDITAVRLNQTAEKLAGIAIIVDRMVENLSKEELSEEKIFQLGDIPPHVWQPRT